MKSSFIKNNLDLSKNIEFFSYANNLLKKNLPVIFDECHINQILQLEDLSYSYKYKQIMCKSKLRTLAMPNNNLRLRQKWILENILEKISISDAAHGFCKTRSIKTNAEIHLNKKFMLNIDIKDFFNNIKKEQVKYIFINIGYHAEVSEIMANLCCNNDMLPQGASTSPYISNLIFKNIDERIISFCQKNNIIYSRYADDLTFSADYDFQYKSNCIIDLIFQGGFIINDKKTRYSLENQKKIVTGIIVTNQLRVPRKFRRKLTQEIYYCSKFGIHEHLTNTQSAKRTNFKEYLYGKAYYIKMIEPELGKEYLNKLENIDWGY